MSSPCQSIASEKFVDDVLSLLTRLSDLSGLVTGVTGAAGNLGGIVYLLISRYEGINYAKFFWIVGIINIGVTLTVTWIRPIPKGQVVTR